MHPIAGPEETSISGLRILFPFHYEFSNPGSRGLFPFLWLETKEKAGRVQHTVAQTLIEIQKLATDVEASSCDSLCLQVENEI